MRVTGRSRVRVVAVVSATAIACLAAPLGSARVSDLPGDITAEATGPAGAIVMYDASPLTCTPASGSLFPLGSTKVDCVAGSNPAGSFNVIVHDTTPPSLIGVPGDISVSTSDPSGAIVPFTPPAATDIVDGSDPVGCVPGSGTKFPVGTTPVNCTSTDAANNTASAGFKVTVTLVDSTPPRFTTVPSNITAEATSSSGATVSYAIAATDNTDPSPSINCDHPSGSTFPITTTHVSCTASDSSGNTSSPVTFDVTVQDTTPPAFPPLSDVSDTTSNSSGKAVSYSTPSATDAVSGTIPGTCSPPSGSTFPVGSTLVTCTATDSSGHTGSATFHVVLSLVDNVPPTLSGVPANITVEANSPAGSTVNYASPSATDAVDGPIALVTCTPASGSTFPLGTTTVTCHATDSHGNTGTASFTVRVRDTTPPHLTLPGHTVVYATTPSGIARSETPVQEFFRAAVARDIADPAPTVTNDAPDFLPVGTTVVTFVAHDASGNTASGRADLEVRPMPAAGTTPPPLPTPTDRVPPDDVANLTATAGDGIVKLVWTKPKASDFDHVVVMRSTTQAGATKDTIYTGSATTFVDRVVQNGVEYRYVVVAVDKTGNASAGAVVVAMPKRAMLRSPRDGARLRKPPRLVWLRMADASYYNVQLFRGDQKILSVWPTKASFLMQRSWKYEHRAFKLTLGLYRWYVWPGYGARANVDYGDLLGSSSFQILR